MKIIVISREEFFPGEAEILNGMFTEGLMGLHLRKLGSTAEEYAALLSGIAGEYRSRIVLHDHYELAEEFGVGGIHLNSRNQPPDFQQLTAQFNPSATVSKASGTNSPTDSRNRMSISRSCHSIEEISLWRERCDYLFLSPVFDSISKSGYRSGFSTQELREARDKGLIDSRIIALGGITGDRLPLLNELGFGGAALLGSIWTAPSPLSALRSFLNKTISF